MTSEVGPTAALAGTPTGIQGQGIWLGRRQLFVRFAAEAETATMYTADALTNEIKRALSRSAVHSIAIAGRDPLNNTAYLAAAFRKGPGLPVMLDSDGQRPSALEAVAKVLTLAQITLEGAALTTDSMIQNAIASLAQSKALGLDHALVLVAGAQTTDAVLLRLVEQAHGASDGAPIIIHPEVGASLDRDRRWPTLIERAAATHANVVFTLRLPSPTALR
jgi:organic radical activating enzyme